MASLLGSVHTGKLAQIGSEEPPTLEIRDEATWQKLGVNVTLDPCHSAYAMERSNAQSRVCVRPRLSPQPSDTHEEGKPAWRLV